ncbi:helix-turn-helix transcriptional regulator [Rhizobium sp. YIM 134829]|uniref:helix-turn-helix transcriptional regulator n=1 Tax=Rhizobium sp. YIM 134829 TaxID=3390453 RepID=UPI0039793948
MDYLSVSFRSIKKEPFSLEIQGVHSGAITQWDTRAPYGFESTPKVRVDKITIRFVTQGAMMRRNFTKEYSGGSDKAMFVAFDEMETEEATPSFAAFTGTVNRDALIAAHLALEGRDDVGFPQFQPVADVDSSAMRAFRQNFRMLYLRRKNGLHSGDMTAGLLEEMILYQFLGSWPRMTGDADPGTILRPSWHVRRAIDYIEANLQNRISVAEIAAVAHTGVRSLQLSFRRELGKTPVQYILERRLARVRADLLSADRDDASIATIANRWGFPHLGDFTRRYRTLYGETALQTRKNRD